MVGLLDAEIARWRAVEPALATPLESLRELVTADGKRLRPAFCHWAYVGAGGAADDPAVVDAGAALELLHTFALVHDDIMDDSDRRRGLVSIHRGFMTRHDDFGWEGEARRFGEGAAILVGDFASTYADMLMGGVPPAARAVFDDLRIELCVGQYLDLLGTASRSRDAEQARTIERYKSGKYTVERPLHLGAALAGRIQELREPLTAIGLPLGEAFQLRDDVLGVYGEAEVTGKPVGDDLREGKLTPLIAFATARATGAGARLLDRIGAPDLTDADVEALRTVLLDTGARDEVERTIERRLGDALDAIERAPLAAPARRALHELAVFVAWRDE
jgi:geranylgeranyl diphosphate synthase type I